ncbi:hypothetical protein [Streptomyces sp. H27-S2]|uniref:hypothetical protein n=1 Tax=Streptomyces antarcticus TaxID=2996458 RepID=UPI00226EF7DF|nr:hypothetical protein [Streptomyces sp. H27-S2]MCY0954142.1 hypothetical protein [Streptomyces sp. H27-S2]
MSSTVAGRAAKRRARRVAGTGAAASRKVRKSERAAKGRSLGRSTVRAVRGQMSPAELAEAIREAFAETVPNGRWRWLGFNGTAAAAGHGLIALGTGNVRGLEPVMGAVMLSLPACGAFVVTLGAAYGAYRVAKPLRGLLGPFAPLAPLGAGLGAAFWGQGTGPLIAEFLAWSAPWSTLFAPLTVAGAAGGLCWLLLDSRSAGRRLPLRWLARIPLATVVLSSLLYAPGALL